jgi:hypothetical protein
MTDTVKFMSRYDLRVKLVKDTLQKHSKLSDKAATDLAEHVLEALDKIPETQR